MPKVILRAVHLDRGYGLEVAFGGFYRKVSLEVFKMNGGKVLSAAEPSSLAASPTTLVRTWTWCKSDRRMHRTAWYIHREGHIRNSCMVES